MVLQTKWHIINFAVFMILINWIEIKGDITMEDQGQTFDLNAGTDALLPCQFQSSTGGLRTVVWNKKLCDGSDVRVNTISVIPPATFLPNPDPSFANHVSNLGSDLIVNSTEDSDSAVYTCIVTIGFESNSTKHYLRIKKNPAGHVLSGDKNEAKVGDTVSLQCTSEGARPFVNHTWQYPTSGSSGPSLSAMNYSAYNADCDPDYGDTVSMLTWTVTSGMLGRRCVTCTATGSAIQGSTSSSEFCYVVKGYAAIDEISNDTQLHTGDAFTLVCNVSGNPPPNVTWVKDGTVKSTTYQLQLLYVTKQDEGCYKCLAAIDSTVTANRTVCITVEDSPIVGIVIAVIVVTVIVIVIVAVVIYKKKSKVEKGHRSSPSSETIILQPSGKEIEKNVGDTLKVTANVKDKTTNQQMEISWFDPSGRKINSDTSESGISGKHGCLTIQTIKKEHGGKYIYRCGRSDEDPSGEMSFVLKVVSGHSSCPCNETLILQPSGKEIEKNVGDTLKVIATVKDKTANQQMEISWFDPSGRKINSDSSESGISGKDGCLTIQTIKKEHGGKYICRCGRSDEDSSGEMSFVLKVVSGGNGHRDTHHYENAVSPDTEKRKKKKKKKKELKPEVQRVAVPRKLPPLPK